MKVLIACEFSGIVRDAFIARGHDAISCDILPTERPGPHWQGDVLHLIERTPDFDLMIAHPPCTYLANSGVRHLAENPNRQLSLMHGARFFRELLECDIPKICIENPIPHNFAVALIGRKYDQIIQPWMFGHFETKATCLWLKGLPKLQPVTNYKGWVDNLPKKDTHKTHYMSPGPNRRHLRSITYQGIADAFAAQWG